MFFISEVKIISNSQGQLMEVSRDLFPVKSEAVAHRIVKLLDKCPLTQSKTLCVTEAI